MKPSTREALEVALAASRPLPASNLESCRELLEIERLVPQHRRCTVAEHQAWRESIATKPPVDPLDAELESEPEGLNQ